MKKTPLILLASIASLRLFGMPDDALYTALLQEHVDAGAVDYAALQDDPRLEQYLSQLAATEPTSLPSDAARIALWMNAYNAYTLKLIVDNYPVESIRDLGTGGKLLSFILKSTPWDKRFAEVGGEIYTLNEIEHEILRKEYNEPRIHFTVVCAAKSCPPLRNEAYVAEKLDDQFQDQARTFLLNPEKNRYDAETNTYHFSKIFDWYGEDFGSNDAELVAALEQFVSRKEMAGGEKPPSGMPKVRFLKYDWSLNEQ